MEQDNKTGQEALVKEIILFIPNLLKLVYRLMQDEAVSRTDRLLLLATVAYVLSPWDFIPDFIPFLGQVDDLVLLALVLKRLMDSVSHEVLENYWDGSEDLLGLIEKVLNLGVSFLPPGVYNKLVKKSHYSQERTEYKVK